MPEDGHAMVTYLRGIIRVSTTGNSYPLSKGLLVLLLLNSKGLTQNNHCTLTVDEAGLSERDIRRICEGSEVLAGPERDLRLNKTLVEFGTRMQFFYSFGRFISEGKYSIEGQYPGGERAFPGLPPEAYKKCALPDSWTFFLANTGRKIDPASVASITTRTELAALGSNKRPKLT